AEVYLQPVPPESEVSPARLEAARLCLDAATKVPEFSRNSLLWLRLAIVQLKAGELDDYRATPTRMFEVFEKATAEANRDPATEANNAAWAAALAPGAPERFGRAVALAEKAVSLAPQNANYLNTYGAVLCRAGRGKEATRQLQKATDL